MDRNWNKLSLMRLASGLLICLGMSSLLPLLLSSWVGSSVFVPGDLKDPGQIRGAILTPSNAPPALHRVLSTLASPEQKKALLQIPSSVSADSTNAAIVALTNILNRALTDPRLRVAEILKSPLISDSTRKTVQTASAELELFRLNRLILQESFPAAFRAIAHRRELPFNTARSYQFLVANLALQVGLLWVITLFLRDEGLSWPQFLRGSAPNPVSTIPFAIGMGISATLFLLPISALSTWLWSLLDHTPQIQQPLLVLQQSSGMLEKLFFVYLAIVGAPFFEEVFFRGILYPTLCQWGWPRSAWIVSSVLFGTIHFDREKFLPLTLFALILIYVYQRTRSLLAPIVTHASFNLVNFVLFVNQDAIRQLLKHNPVTHE